MISDQYIIEYTNDNSTVLHIAKMDDLLTSSLKIESGGPLLRVSAGNIYKAIYMGVFLMIDRQRQSRYLTELKVRMSILNRNEVYGNVTTKIHPLYHQHLIIFIFVARSIIFT